MSKEILMAKEQEVSTIREKVKKAKSVVIVDYRGLTVLQDTQMRVEMRKSGVEYKVLKNRLVLRALEAEGFKGLNKALEGPSAIAFGYDDVVAPAKIIAEFMAKTNNKISVKGGVVEGKVSSNADIIALSKIPAKPILIAQLLGMLQSPIRNLACNLAQIAEKKA